MDQQLYEQKLKEIRDKYPRSLGGLYQYLRVQKTWKLIRTYCSNCGTGFNKNKNHKFNTHKCKKIYKY